MEDSSDQDPAARIESFKDLLGESIRESPGVSNTVNSCYSGQSLGT